MSVLSRAAEVDAYWVQAGGRRRNGNVPVSG
jgi:hypothetical protein